MIIAIVFYVVAGVALIAVEQRLLRLAETDPGLDWLNDHVYTPMLRTLLVLAFVALAYPALFGLDNAPGLWVVLRGGRADILITAAFAASLVLPLAPMVDRLPGAVLAAQGILACCLLAAWLGDAMGLPETPLWMGFWTMLQVILVLLAGKLLGGLIVKFYVPARRRGTAGIVEEATRLTSEIPAIALYAQALGRSLSG